MRSMDKTETKFFAVIEHRGSELRILEAYETIEQCRTEASRLNRFGDFSYSAQEVTWTTISSIWNPPDLSKQRILRSSGIDLYPNVQRRVGRW